MKTFHYLIQASWLSPVLTLFVPFQNYILLLLQKYDTAQESKERSKIKLASFTISRRDKSEKFWRATGQSNLPDRRRLFHWPKCSCVSTKTKLWKLLLRPVVCIPNLIVQVRQNCSLAIAHECETVLGEMRCGSQV